MKHKHHIIPKHMGGDDSPENLIELTVEEHSLAHLKLYEQFGKIEDLCAYYMLSGKNKDPEFNSFRGKIGGPACAQKRKESGLTGIELFYGRPVSAEEQKVNSSKGGKVQGERNRDSGHMNKIQKMVDMSVQGKLNAEICRQKKVNAFFNPELRKESASKGGKVQGKRNAESGHLKRIAQIPRKRNTGKFWVTDGEKSLLINPTDVIPDGFKKGRKIKKI